MASIYDDIINGTFANPAMQTSGWGKPVDSPPSYLRQGTSGVNFNPGVGFVPGAIPTNRLPSTSDYAVTPQNKAGIANAQAAYESGGGYFMDPKTGQFSYTNPTATNPAATAAAGQAAGYPTVSGYPDPNPPWPASVDDRLNARAKAGLYPSLPQQGANPGMGGALIGNGQMAPGIAPQGPPPAGITPTVWAGSNGSSTPTPPWSPAPITQGTDGYTYQNGKVVGLTDWALRGRQQGLAPSGQYAAANLAGQLKAQIRGEQGRAAGQTTAIEKLRAQGMSPSDAYNAANAVDYSGKGYSAADRLQAQQAQRGGGGGDSLMSNGNSGPSGFAQYLLRNGSPK